MESLKVTIKFINGMATPEQHLHLDALLGSLRVNQVSKERDSAIDPRDYHYDLPLERYTEEESGEWVFKASAFKLVNLAHRAIWMQTGRINLEAVADHRNEGWLALRANKVITAGGPFKTSLFQVPIVWCDLVAYCVGDKAELEKLLVECRQVGSRRGVGLGQVESITVERVAPNECDWQYRAMPLGSPGLEKSHAKAITSIRAPYWDRCQHVPALVPI